MGFDLKFIKPFFLLRIIKLGEFLNRYKYLLKRTNFSNEGIEVKIRRVSNTGRHKVIDTECSSGIIKILANASTEPQNPKTPH